MREEHSPDKNHNKRCRADRRRVLRLIGATGISSGIAGEKLIGNAYGQRSSETEIIYAYRHKDIGSPEQGIEPVKKSVPSGWWNNLTRAFDTKEQKQRDWFSREGVFRVGVSPGEAGGENTRIIVTIDEKHAGNTRGEIPERKNGIPIETRTRDKNKGEKLENCSDKLNHNTSDHGGFIPGGMLCEGSDSSGSQACGTLAPKIVEEDGYDAWFVTANHLYGGQGNDHKGEPLYHPDEQVGDAVGTVYQGHCYDDFIRITPNLDHYPESIIEGANPDTVSGQFTKGGLSDLKRQNIALEKIGCATGHSSGAIKEVDETTFNYGCMPKDGVVTWGSNSKAAPGDSGSVNYAPDPDQPNDAIMIGAFNNYRTPYHVEGVGAYSVKSAHKLHF